MDLGEAPVTPTQDFRALDDSTTFDFNATSSAIQNRKRRRSSLRRVSFAEQPSIHVFARDDDYETPPEGTTSHLSAQSTPTSISRSPQRRSERLSSARGGRQDENEMDKENVPVSVGSNGRQGRRGRRPLALRDTQKEKDEEYLKPANWLDDQENLAFGSCDDNTGPVDLRHISFDNHRVAEDDDDNMTMDSQTFHTRMSQMFVKQPLPRLSEEKLVDVATPGQYTDMEWTAGLTLRQALKRERQVLEQPTWHRGDDDSDMSQGSFSELSIIRVLAKNKSAAKESDTHDFEENAMGGGDNWTEDDAQSDGSMPSMQIKRIGSLHDMDDAVSMGTSSPQSNGDRSKLLRDKHLMADEGEQDADILDSEGSDGLQLQGRRKDVELQGRGPIVQLNDRTSRYDQDDSISMETPSQSHADGNDATMTIDSGTDERPLFLGKQILATSKEFETKAPEPQQLNSVTFDTGHRAFNSSLQSSATADFSVPSKQYEKKLEQLRTSPAENDISAPFEPSRDSNSQLLRSQGPEAPLRRQEVGQHGHGLERQESLSQHRTVDKESRESMGLEACDGFVNHGIEQLPSLSEPDENTEPMDITRTWNGRAPQHTSVPTRSSDSAKSFSWLDKSHRMNMSDLDVTEKYEEGITEAIPKWKDVLGGYDCDSPSAEPLCRILQRKNDFDAEDSPVHGLTAEGDLKKALSSKEDVALRGEAEEKETVSNRGLEDSTVELHLNNGKKRMFQNPEDTFSFKGYQKSTRETSVSPDMEQNVTPRPTYSSVRERVDVIETNLRNQSAPHNSERNFQDEDITGDLTDQHDWRDEVSSDMSTTPLSPRRPDYFQRLVPKPRAVPVQMGLSDSPSFEDGITAAIPNVQDLLAADAGTPESELGWDPRKIVWSAQQSSRQAMGDAEVLHQPRKDQMEDETMDSMPDILRTPRAQQVAERLFESMTEEAAKTLNEVSHSKEVRNSLASKMVLRMVSPQGKGYPEAECSSDWESQQILRRTLQFHPESDSQLQSQSLRTRDTEQQISAEDPDGAVEVESTKDVDEETDSTETRIESLRQESRRKKLLQDMQVAEEKLAALNRRSEELRARAQDYHQAIAKRCRNDSCFEMKELAAFCSQAHVSKLKKRCQLLNCMQWWDLKSTKTGDNQVLHEFKYWSLLTHSIFERKANNQEVIVSKSSIDLNEESINQVYRHMNASLAWRWFLLGQEEIIQPQSLFYHIQGVSSKVTILLDLMEEMKNCRKYLVIPHFRLQTDTGLQVGLQFANSELLFDFVVLLDMSQVVQMSYSRKHELDCAMEMHQKLDCAVEMEAVGRFYGKKITEAEIKSCVASVVPGPQLLPRVCSCISTLFERIKEQ